MLKCQAQIATAVEQQAHVAEDVNQQIVNISNLAESTPTECKSVE
ncbi:hypothetical protein ACT691_00940 [Vibrio metschnikovii]